MSMPPNRTVNTDPSIPMYRQQQQQQTTYSYQKSQQQQQASNVKFFFYLSLKIDFIF
jgi:hypothetical protein